MTIYHLQCVTLSTLCSWETHAYHMTTSASHIWKIKWLLVLSLQFDFDHQYLITLWNQFKQIMLEFLRQNVNTVIMMFPWKERVHQTWLHIWRYTEYYTALMINMITYNRETIPPFTRICTLKRKYNLDKRYYLIHLILSKNGIQQIAASRKS